MIGIDATTGKRLTGLDHLRQSIADILTTPIGTRVGRRDYGSMLFELMDRPMNAIGRARLFAAVATAIARWEPRIRVTRIRLADGDARGRFTLSLEGTSTEEPGPNGLLQLSIPLNLSTSPA